MGNGDSARVKLDISENDRKITKQEGVADWGNKIVFHWPEEGISPKSGKPWMEKVTQVAKTAAKKMESEILRQGGIKRILTEFEQQESEKIEKERRQNLIKDLTFYY